MKKPCFILSVILCTALFFNNITAFADINNDGILTLEEAKEKALKNDVGYNHQEDYIQDALEEYEELCEDSSINYTKGSNIAEKAEAKISQKVQLENAYSGIRKAVLNKADLKKSSDYEVTNYYYSVIEAQNSLKNAEESLELKKNDLDISKIKYSLKLISKDSFSQAESSYESSKTEYDNALSEYKNSISKLTKSIGEDLDASDIKLDTAINLPDIRSLDLTKIKEDYWKNNISYFSVTEEYELAEYKLDLTIDKYDDYLEELKYMTESVEEKFDNMLYDAQKAFDDAEYSYNEKLDDLDESIESKYTTLKDLYESYEDQKEEIEENKLTVEENKIKYRMGIIKKAALDSIIADLRSSENQLYSIKVNIIMQYMDLTQYSCD